MAAIRVLVVDDEEAVVDVLTTLIGTDPSLELVGAAHDAEGGIRLAVERRPDVVLMDVRMPGGGGIRAVREITRRCPGAGVVAVSAHEDADTRIRMIGAGARDYVPKSESTDAILAAIHRSAPDGRTGRRRKPVDLEEVEARRTEQRTRVERVLRSRSVAVTFRPIADVETGAVVGVEARPDVAALPRRPFDAWAGEADAVGLLAELELAAVRSATVAIRSLPAGVFVSIEVGPSTVEASTFRRSIRAAIGPRLVLGISELSHPDVGLLAALAPLRERGVRLELRDVGTNVAELEQLADLAPEFLRLDRGLTDGVETDPIRHAVVAGVVGWASTIDAAVIAAGVTSRIQAEELAALGVRLLQQEADPPLHLADLVAGALGFTDPAPTDHADPEERDPR
jgi:DNA-binding NarL/FixJ family response regulator